MSYARPSNPQIKDTNLYFSGLPSGLNINELAEIFQPFGKIIASRVLTDQLSGKECLWRHIIAFAPPSVGYPRGVGFVRFDKHIEAERAIASLHNKTLNGSKPLVVKFAKNPLYNHQHSNNINFPRQQRDYSNRKTRWRNTSCFILWRHLFRLPNDLEVVKPSPNGPTFCIFIFNLHPEWDEVVLWKLFGPFGAICSVKVARLRTWRHTDTFVMTS